MNSKTRMEYIYGILITLSQSLDYMGVHQITSIRVQNHLVHVLTFAE